MRSPRVTLITAGELLPERELVSRLARAGRWNEGARARVAVQLRDPELEGSALWALGVRLRRLTRELGMSLVVNDRLDLAVALEADGVHLGRRSVSVVDARALLGAEAWVSVTAHVVEEVSRAASDQASAVLLSPVFDSPGKGPALGVAAIGRARTLLDAEPPARRPSLIALGGIDAARAAEVLAAGADGVAAIRADLLASDALFA